MCFVYAVYVHMYVGSHDNMHLWRPEEDIRCPTLVLSTSQHGPGVGIRHVQSCPASYVGAGI